VMQPYFMPYAGYFRLFRAADVFVVFDCVQFPRRGWVHRNRFLRCDGSLDWLTLPVMKCPRDTRIDALAFSPDADARLAADIQGFPGLGKARADRPALLDLVTHIGTGTVADYLCGQLVSVAAMLGLSKTVVRSSELSLDPAALLSGYAKPVLILQGLRDLQVAREDAERLQRADPRAALALVANANHVLKTVRTDDPSENIATYTNPDLPLADSIVDVISAFVRR